MPLLFGFKGYLISRDTRLRNSLICVDLASPIYMSKKLFK